MSYMDRILEDPEIPADSGISIEFQIPLTSKRIDFIITGQNEEQKKQAIIIEFTDVLKRSGMDRSVRGIRTLIKKIRQRTCAFAEEIIKNTYRTLLTRGMKGCYVYFCDKPLEAYLRQLLATPLPAQP